MHYKNLHLLSNLTSGQIVTCDSSKQLKINSGFGAGWLKPHPHMIITIEQSFENYFRIVELIHSPMFKTQSHITIPNLRTALSGLQILIDTYKSVKNHNIKFVQQLSTLYTDLYNKLDKLEHKYPDFFSKSKYVEYVSIEHIESELNAIDVNIEIKSIDTNIENNYDTNDTNDNQTKPKTKNLIKYLIIVKQTIRNCCQTLGQKCQSLINRINNTIRKLKTKKNSNQHTKQVSETPTVSNDPITTL